MNEIFQIIPPLIRLNKEACSFSHKKKSLVYIDGLSLQHRPTTTFILWKMWQHLIAR